MIVLQKLLFHLCNYLSFTSDLKRRKRFVLRNDVGSWSLASGSISVLKFGSHWMIWNVGRIKGMEIEMAKELGAIYACNFLF